MWDDSNVNKMQTSHCTIKQTHGFWLPSWTLINSKTWSCSRTSSLLGHPIYTVPLSELFHFDWVIHSSTVLFCFMVVFKKDTNRESLFIWPFCNICIFTTIRAAFTLPEVDAHSCMCLQMLARWKQWLHVMSTWMFSQLMGRQRWYCRMFWWVLSNMAVTLGESVIERRYVSTNQYKGMIDSGSWCT